MSGSFENGVPLRASSSARGGILVVRVSCSPAAMPGNDMYGRHSMPWPEALTSTSALMSPNARVVTVTGIE